MSSGENDQDSGSTITLSKIISYGFGILFILAGLGGLLQGPGAVLILLGGLFALPPVRRQITGRSGVSFSRWVVVVIVIALIGAGGATLPQSDGGNQASVSNGGEADPATATPTMTPKQQPLTHQIGDSFVVGSGEQSIEYTVVDTAVQESVGGETLGEDADGIYLVVILEMENVGDESFDISDRHLRAVDDQDRAFEADFEASAYADSDPRIDAEGITYDQLNPGLSTTRAVIFDVSAGGEYRLKIEPAGVFSDADEHYVPLGSVESESS